MTALLLRTLPGRAVGLHVAAAVVLLAATASSLEHDTAAVMVLRGLAVVLAATLALAVDEPAVELLDATATTFGRRVATRLRLLVPVAALLWGVALVLVARRGGTVPQAALTLELLALVAVGLALPSALRRWRRTAEPALITGPVLLGLLLAAAYMPRRLTLLPMSAADPAWGDAHLRWALLLVVAVVALTAALADPATARTRGLRRSSRLSGGGPR